MKYVVFFMVVSGLWSCSSIELRRKESVVIEPLFYATIVNKVPIELEENESMAGRVLIGLATSGLVGAVATAYTEPGFSRPKAFDYEMLVDGTTNKEKFISFSDVANGSCVRVFYTSGTKMKLLRVTKPIECAN